MISITAIGGGKSGSFHVIFNDMEIRTLEHTPLKEIYECFTDAFANYVIPLQFDEEMTMERWKLADVDYRLSYGAFDGEHLVGFIIHIKTGDQLFNFGTGVIPSHRGQRLVQKMYQKIEADHGEKFSLEVIKENTRALQIYELIGFKKDRDLISVQGILNINTPVDKKYHYEVKSLNYSDEMARIRLYNPSIENSSDILLRYPDHYELHELRLEKKLVAYAVYYPKTGSIKEIGASSPVEDNLDQLFLEMKLNGEKLRVMNIDGKAKELISYFCDRDVNIFVSQHEMIKVR